MFADLLENLAVHLGHHFCGEHAVPVLLRKEPLGFRVEVHCLLVLMLHERFKTRRRTSFQNLALCDFEASQVFQREVNAAVAGVLADIADDVGELQGITQRHSVVFARRFV